MSLRKHKYKQRLEELKRRLTERREQLVEETKGKDYDAFREGMKAMVAEALTWMTIDEEAEQRKDEEARARKNVKKARKRKEKSERDMWCAECAATFTYGEAYYFDGLKEHLRCPILDCGSSDVRFGAGPQDRAP
jgi:hypothetical protein